MDRLSELPQSVIFHIFWLLPMNDVVKTIILSKRWINLWTTTPFINFVYDTKLFATKNKFRNFVNRVLLLWNGEEVQKFKVDSCNDDSVFLDIALWVRFAKRYEVQELYLHLDVDFDSIVLSDHTQVCWVPRCLYSCSWLKELSIRNFYFRINSDVQWDQLKSLTITEGFGVTEHVINQILSGSPRLEVLSLSFVERGESLCIRSTSLKEFSMLKFLYSSYDVGDWYTELRIWTPNLEKLEIKGSPYNKCFLMDVSSLTHATLGFFGLHLHHDEEFCDFSGFDGFLSAKDFLGGSSNQTPPSIQHVENITLLPCCVKALGAVLERCMKSFSSNVKSLQLGYYLNREEQLVGIVEIFPQLKKLVLKVREKNEYNDVRERLEFDDNRYLQFEANLPMSFVMELKIVEVTWVEDENIFRFLQFLLKYASKLEKMVLRVKEIKALEKLMKMPRSSRSCIVYIL